MQNERERGGKGFVRSFWLFYASVLLVGRLITRAFEMKSLCVGEPYSDSFYFKILRLFWRGEKERENPPERERERERVRLEK